MTTPDWRAGMSEDQLQACVIEYAELRKWLWWHDQDSRRNPAGLPDLILVRSGRLVFAELKATGGRIRDRQRDWLTQLELVARGNSDGAVQVFVWRPLDWINGTIRRVLA